MPRWIAGHWKLNQRSPQHGSLNHWALTHAGTVRRLNEDALVAYPELGLWAVADGAGGHHAGEVASGMIGDALRGLAPTLRAEAVLAQVRDRLATVHQALLDRAVQEKGEGAVIASTVVVLMLGQGHFACLWAGDSRAYLLRHGALQAITRDHSLVQDMVDRGELDAEAAEHSPQANIITRAVGAGPQPLELEKVIGAVLPGDRFLLCSDGLTKSLAGPALARLTAGADPAARLVEAALDAGARDNVTAVVIEVAR